jgi:hypothetical protein
MASSIARTSGTWALGSPSTGSSSRSKRGGLPARGHHACRGQPRWGSLSHSWLVEPEKNLTGKLPEARRSGHAKDQPPRGFRTLDPALPTNLRARPCLALCSGHEEIGRGGGERRTEPSVAWRLQKTVDCRIPLVGLDHDRPARGAAHIPSRPEDLAHPPGKVPSSVSILRPCEIPVLGRCIRPTPVLSPGVRRLNEAYFCFPPQNPR